LRKKIVEPYRFEPERVVNDQDGDDSPHDENSGVERLQNLTWCTCGKCDIRETPRECICCLEEPESENKVAEGTLYKM